VARPEVVRQPRDLCRTRAFYEAAATTTKHGGGGGGVKMPPPTARTIQTDAMCLHLGDKTTGFLQLLQRL